jgi:hypothetical protein
MTLFFCGAIEDGNKFGRRKGVGRFGKICGIMGCNVNGVGGSQQGQQAMLPQDGRARENVGRRHQGATLPRVGCTRCGIGRVVSAMEQSCQELAERAMVLAERTLADEHCHREAAECSATLAKTSLAKEHCCSLLAEAALAEYDAQTKASWDAATVEVVKHATTLAVTVLTKLEAAPKLRYSGPPLTHFPPPRTAAEVAELNATILDKGLCHETDAKERYCDKANKEHCNKATTQEKALDDDACK